MVVAVDLERDGKPLVHSDVLATLTAMLRATGIMFAAVEFRSYLSLLFYSCWTIFISVQNEYSLSVKFKWVLNSKLKR